MKLYCLAFSLFLLALAAGRSADAAAPASAGIVEHDVGARTVTMADARRNLVIRLNYGERCYLDQVIVDGREVAAPDTGVCTGIERRGAWTTTRSGLATPQIRVSGSEVDVDGIAYGPEDFPVREEWRFVAGADQIDWRIRRHYAASGDLDDTAFPGWDFAAMDTWTGGILDTGGVAWGKLIDDGSSYGEHAGGVAFWKPGLRDMLKITTRPGAGVRVASRFSHQPTGVFSYFQTASDTDIATLQGLRRYVGGMRVWAPVPVRPGVVQVDMRLQAADFDREYGRGRFSGIDGDAVTRLLNTIGRYGVIDRKILGGNGWRSGFCCLHEPFFGEMGIAIDDPAYTANLVATIDDWQAHAVKPDGRVLARWCHEAGGDNMVPGTYDPRTGYYDCGWGYLLDAQPDYVINTAGAFDLTGDRGWLRAHKASCERALDWLLARDFDGSGLMTMMTDSHRQQKSSDWIDIVYACGKNALVNAEMYYALTLWAGRETVLGDREHAARYRAAAAKLRAAFVRPVSQGGFWDPDKGYFVYWLEKDGSAHGDNLVTPVNFCAVAYGIATPEQSKSILDTIETRMQAEGLFHWPLCFTSYAPDECRGMMPFPQYENGDIFLSWGEVAVRAYASHDPSVAVKYVRRILDRYRKDGLAYQRCLRGSQDGAGDDILAGNSMTVVGLYRDIYGIRPQWDRLLLDPHLTPDLAGTRLRYRLRDREYGIRLEKDAASVSVAGVTVRSAGAFAVGPEEDDLLCYAGTQDRPAFRFAARKAQTLAVAVESWPSANGTVCRWTETSARGPIPATRVLMGLKPETRYRLSVGGKAVSAVRTNAAGEAAVVRPSALREARFTLSPQ